MQIGITNPLREFLKWKPFPPNTEELLFFCWDAHRVKIDGRMMLVLCNAANRFACITAMRAADWKNLEEVCRELIASSLLECGFTEPAIEQYLARAGAVEFTRTHGRKALGCMNSLISSLLVRDCERDKQLQPDLMYFANVFAASKSAGHEDYRHPADLMVEDFLDVGINPHEGTRLMLDFSESDSDTAESELRSMLEEEYRRQTSQHEAQAARKCTVCGADPVVFLGNVPYCADCYNRMTEQAEGIPHVTNDSSVLPVFSGGKVVEFAVQRILMPPNALWTAHEIVEGGSPNYEGVEVCVHTDMFEDQEETLSRLWQKAQEAMSNPSTKPFDPPEGIERISNGVHIDGQALFAKEVGWAHIDEDEQGRICVIVDGRHYSAEQFLELFGCYAGFNLHWEIHDSSDDLPSSRRALLLPEDES